MEGIVVVKCGGSTVTSLTEAFFQELVELKKYGRHPVIVHGGGPVINEMLETFQVETTFVNGLRKTTPEVFQVAEMVLSGQVNKMIVEKIQEAGGQAAGISCADGPIVQAEVIDEVQLGLVGQPADTDPSLIYSLCEAGIIPVVSPVSQNKAGGRLNVNADTAAGAVAEACCAEEMVFVTDVPGVQAEGEVIPTLTKEEAKALLQDETIYGGMIPKVQAAMNCLDGHVKKVVIASGTAAEKPADGTIQGTAITAGTTPAEQKVETG
ncbi:N-acetylglutamate kinase [Salsuginibacillus halophilus]|uniref:Acetylglutamate kinase n=1 Tax=Salsuginibacillus halophilus TaxID=517424 RepID=A0A2P8HXK0_9BACI|nr:acetylglutamate kinase [Salsuginibacillus halophilus]PSL50940.1 N-acetylglutamate kinase [Salsuginibacillus halophilus]